MTPHRSLPLRRVDGYVPIEDHGLIGDGATAALVGRDGAVSWLCIPRFDSPSLFCSLLDRVRGGAFTVAPEPLLDSRQSYEEDSAVLVTELRGPDGTVQITDALSLRAAPTSPKTPRRARRVAPPRDGAARAGTALGRAGAPGRRLRHPTRRGSGAEAAHPPRACPASRQQQPAGGTPLIPRAGGGQPAGAGAALGRDSIFARRTLEQRLETTRAAWRGWLDCFLYTGLREPLVRRSAITLKLCDHLANGAMVAAPTSSLPEAIGGTRTGTTGTPGSGIPPSRCTPCGASASPPRPAPTSGPQAAGS
jgi:alpha,alpha-trehalase